MIAIYESMQPPEVITGKMGRALLVLAVWLSSFAVQLVVPANASAAGQPASTSFETVLPADSATLIESYRIGADEIGSGDDAEGWLAAASVSVERCKPDLGRTTNVVHSPNSGASCYDARGPPFA